MKNLIGIFLVISNFFGTYFPLKQYYILIKGYETLNSMLLLKLLD